MFTVPLEEVESKLASLQALVAQCRATATSHLKESQCVEAAKLAQELRITTNPPRNVGNEITMLPYIATAARLAIDLGIFKALALRSPQTCKELASYARSYTRAPVVDSDFIARIMRLLTLFGLARESGPSTYSTNANTYAFAAPDEAFQSMLAHFYDNYMPVLKHSVPYFADRGYVMPSDPAAGPFQDFWQTDQPTYDYWLKLPPVHLERLNKLMKAIQSEPWYDWMDAGLMVERRMKEVRRDSPHMSPGRQLLVVDLGGGKGVMVHSLRKRLDESRVAGTVVLQERPATITDALSAAASLGCSPETGMAGVEYLSHDFFEPQPEECNGSLYYYISYVLHNWNDDLSIQILKNIARAMAPGYSRLLINERVLQPTGNDILKAGLDFHMAYSHGSRERTLDEFEALVEAAGMKLVEYHRSPDGGQDVIECELA